jgi:cytochrome c peroxidase
MLCDAPVRAAHPAMSPSPKNSAPTNATRARRAARLAALAAVACAVAVAAAGAQDRPRSFHGEAPPEEQLAALARLGLPGDALAPPRGVDAVLWHALGARGGAQRVAPTAEVVALGRDLYFDVRLSKNATVSCSTCHDVTRGFADQRPTSQGIGAQLGQRNAPTTLNAALLEPQFWDGRAADVEAQAVLPIVNPIEMGAQTPEEVVARLAAVPEYAAAFERAFGGGVTYERIGLALGAFERTLVMLDAPFDDFLAGDGRAVTPAAQRGWALFNGKARCAGCHPISPLDPLGTDQSFHNVGVAASARDFEALAHTALAALAEDPSIETVERLALEHDTSALGRFLVTRRVADIGAFRTQPLRNVGLTAPYMHDGSHATLWDVVDHYNKGGEANLYLDGAIEPLDLAEDEIDDLVAFLFALTDRRLAAQNAEQIARQATRAASERPFRDEALARRQRLPFEDRVLGGER